MSKDEFLQQYAKALQAQAAAETQVKVLEMRAKLEFGNPIDGEPGASAANDNSEVNEFIKKNKPELTADDIDFLLLVEATAKQVANWWEVSVSKVNRTLRRGIFKHGVSSVPGASHTISTVSVVRAVFNGEAKKET